MAIKIVNGALDVIVIGDKEYLALRGVVDPTSIADIKVSDYQREILSNKKIDVLKKALKGSRVPDIDLGMRGSEVQEAGDGVFYLQDEVYVIDGLQRKTAGEELVEEGYMPHLGAIVHFDTNEAWERERFEALNVGQTGLSNNVMLRNLAHTSDGAAAMYALAGNASFVLHNRVTWGQNMRRGDLITAITLYKVVGRLHSNHGPGKSDARSLAKTGISKIMANTGKMNFISNVKDFFCFIDEVYGIQTVAYRNQATQLKSSFMLALAGVLSDHENFWDGNHLRIPADLRRKFGTFPISDRHVKDLAGSAGNGIFLLERLMIDHLNSGKRTRRLRLRAGLSPVEVLQEDGDDDATDGAA